MAWSVFLLATRRQSRNRNRYLANENQVEEYPSEFNLPGQINPQDHLWIQNFQDISHLDLHQRAFASPNPHYPPPVHPLYDQNNNQRNGASGSGLDAVKTNTGNEKPTYLTKKQLYEKFCRGQRGRKAKQEARRKFRQEVKKLEQQAARERARRKLSRRMKDIILALVTRVLFIAHALIAIWRAYSEYNTFQMWLLLIPVGVLVLEALFTVGARGGEEYKWISPCVFLYLASVVPSVWFLEMKNFDRRQTRHLCNDLHWGLMSSPGCFKTFEHFEETPFYENVEYIISNVTLRKDACEAEFRYLQEKNDTIITTTVASLFTTNILPADGAVGDVLQGINEGKKVIDNLMQNINFFNETTWVLVMHQLLLFFLIVGRWLLPTGEGISRDQLSQLLLVFIGVGADILEFVTETIKETEVRCDKTLVIVIMGFWSWSTLQFSLVLTATRARRTRAVGIYEGDEENESPVVVVEEEDKPGRCVSFVKNMEVWGIFSTLILQDGPFLATRIYIMVGRGVVHQMIVFFTTKNALVVILQLYRLSIIAFAKAKEEEEEDDEFDISALEALGGNIGGKMENGEKNGGSNEDIMKNHESEKKESRNTEKVTEVHEVNENNTSANNNKTTSIAYVNIPKPLLP